MSTDQIYLYLALKCFYDPTINAMRIGDDDPVNGVTISSGVGQEPYRSLNIIHSTSNKTKCRLSCFSDLHCVISPLKQYPIIQLSLNLP